MTAVAWARPESLAELTGLLAERTDARVIAGGTDLMTAVRAGTRFPCLVNVFRIPELRGIRRLPEAIEIGAAVTVASLLRSGDVAEAAPLLGAAADRFASPLVRSRATVGGNLCNASPAADVSLALLALDAEVVLASREGERTLGVADFVLGPRRTALRPGEIVARVRIPAAGAGTQSAFQKSGSRPALEISAAAVALRLRIAGGIVREARIACGAVAPVPMRAAGAERSLVGRPLDAAAAAAAAQSAAREVAPIDDARASATHRRRLVHAFVLRGLSAMMPGIPVEGRS